MDVARRLYLISYDVSSAKRLHAVRRFLTGYKVGGQKSVFEVWATAAELRRIRETLSRKIDLGSDRIHLFLLDPRMRPWCYGQAEHCAGDFFLIV